MNLKTISFQKLVDNSVFLRSLYHRGCDVEDIANFELFDENYKLALRVLYMQRYPCHVAAHGLGLDSEIVYLVRKALDPTET